MSSSSSSRLATELLLSYARRVPHHKGKQRLSDLLRRSFGVKLQGESVELRGGLRWSLDPGDFVCQDLFWSGAKDRAELRQVFRLMPPGGSMLDVGANFGYYSLMVAARLRQNCVVHAFEPNPATFQRLCRNLKLNGFDSVVPHCEGLSDCEGDAAVVTESGNSGADYLRSGGEIRVTTVDRFCDLQAISRLDLIKLDAEGYEMRILAGARRTLEQFRPPLLLELNSQTLLRENATPEAVVSFLNDLDYRVRSIKPSRDITPHSRFTRISNVLCEPR